MANIATGIDKIGDIAECLNNIITTTGKKIDINNKTIWDGYLHQWTNNDWYDMLEGFNAILQSQPDAVKTFHKNNYEKAVIALKKDHNASDRALDKKNNKRIAWAMIQTFREVWNSLHDKDIPNEDAKPTKKKVKNKVTTEHTEEYTRVTIWHNLFDLDD